MSARIVIVRHGNTFESGEPPRRIGARTDLPLTAAGHAQAAALGAAFADRRFARAYVSPLARAKETASAIVGDAETADWLAEIDHGPDEDRPEAEVAARIGAQALAAWDERGIPPPGWIVDADARIAAWRRLFVEATGDVLCVTSNGAARFAPIAGGLRSPSGLKLRTGAWGTIAIEGGAARLLEWDVRP